MPTTIAIETTLEMVVCCNCGMSFAVPDVVLRERKRDHKLFYCPAGHSQYFPGESDIEKLKKELKKAQQFAKEMDAARIHAEDQRQAAERSRRAAVAAHTRTKNRIAAGLCPCCNRHFDNLQGHMETKHPEYKEQAE